MHFEHSAEVEALSLAVRWAGLRDLSLLLIGCGAGLADLSHAPLAEITAAVPATVRPVVNWVIEIPCYKPSHVEASQQVREAERMTPLFNLTGKVAVVTGSSRGAVGSVSV